MYNHILNHILIIH